jgi:hypothetical protein
MINGDTTTKNWLEIATLIVLIITAVATICAPLLAVFVQYRINQPKPSPEANQPKNRSTLWRSPNGTLSDYSVSLLTASTSA